MSDSTTPTVDLPADRDNHRLRRLSVIGLSLFIAVSLSHCAGKGYNAASYSPEKLATPPHDNLSQREYPFDSDGKYRKDWVKNGSRTPGSANTKRSKTASTSSAPAPAPAPTPAPTRSTNVASSYQPPQSISPPRTTVQPAASKPTYTPAPKPKPKPKPAPKPAARYHTVTSGQTLWAISQRYNTSVDALKRTNGLRNNTIRPGQSLRIP